MTDSTAEMRPEPICGMNTWMAAPAHVLKVLEENFNREGHTYVNASANAIYLGLGAKADGLHTAYSGLVAKRQHAKRSEPKADATEPASPLASRRAEWPPRVEFLKRKLAGMGPQERADFLERDADMAFIAANRGGDWEAIQQLHAELTDAERG